MTRTEQIKLVRRAGVYIRVAEQCNFTSFATLVIGVPLTLAAFAGLSIWPGVVFWTVAWGSRALSDYYMAAAAELHRLVNEARTSG
jgi:hypothetical protein